MSKCIRMLNGYFNLDPSTLNNFQSLGVISVHYSVIKIQVILAKLYYFSNSH